MINATAETFKNEVLEEKGMVMVDFWAPWCGPCKMLGPVMDEIARERNDIKVVKVNVEEQAALAQEYHISSIPHIMVFRDGEIVDQSVGFLSKERLLQMV